MFYLILVLFVIVGSALTILTVQNLSTSVQLMLFGLKTPGIPPGLLIFLSFLLGALLLYLVAIFSARHDRRRIRKLRQRVRELEQEKMQANLQQPPPQMAMNMPQSPANMSPPMNMPPANMPPPMNMPPPNMQQPPANMPPMNMPSGNIPPMNTPPASPSPRSPLRMPGMSGPIQN